MTDKPEAVALKPCPNPWCEDSLYCVENRPPLWRVACGCGVKGPTTYREDTAIAAWNTRAQPDASALVDALRATQTELERIAHTKATDFHAVHLLIVGIRAALTAWEQSNG